MNTAVHEGIIKEDSIDRILESLRRSGWLPKQGQKSDYSACLTALVVALDIPIEVSNLCETLPYGGQNIDLVAVLNSLSNMGYIARPAKVRLCDLDERLLPCLFVSENNIDSNISPIVVLEKRTLDGNISEFLVFDGRDEVIKTITSLDPISGKAYFFTKESDIEDAFSEDMRQASGHSWFRTLLEKFRDVFWQTFVLSIFLGIISLSTPLFIMMVYDQVINTHSSKTLSLLIMGVVLAVVTEWLLRSIRTRSLSWLSARLDNIVSNKIFEQLLLMPPIYTERASVASQIARIKAFETVRDFFSSSLFLSLIELPITLLFLAVIILMAGVVAIVPIITALLYVVLILWARAKLRTAIKMSSQAAARRQQLVLESLEKIHSLRACGLTSSWFKEFRDLSGKASLTEFRSKHLASIIETISHGLFILAGMLTLVVGIEMVWAEAITVGTLIAVIIMVWRVLGPFQAFCNSIPQYEQLQNAVSQVNRLMDIQTEYVKGEQTSKVDKIKGHLTFSKVGLRYSKESDPVFAGLSLDVQPGELVAVTGSNGSGKTTILKLACGLYQQQAGTIRIDGRDIRQLNTLELRKHISYVSQSPHFFQGTIAENLRFAEPLVSDEVLENSLRLVDAWKDVHSLPDGLDTVINRNLIGLPSSLAYRLSLARAYIKDSSLMLFDELPYALLNSHAGDVFFQTLESWKGKRTILMVTHRDDYLKLSNKTVLLRTGEVPLVGSPDLIIKAINKSNEII